MRIIGQYKRCEISITDLYMSETYAGFLALSERLYDEANRRLVNEDVPKIVEKIWGKGRNLYTVDINTIDYKKLLPRVRVIVCLCCLEPIKDGHASELFMAWFQESDEDPFAKAASNLKQIKWEEKARDFCF